MPGYFITYLVGVVSYVTAWMAIWRAIHAGPRLTMERVFSAGTTLWLLAPIGAVLAFVGAAGMSHESRYGQDPPVPLALIWSVIGLGLVPVILMQQWVFWTVIRLVRRRRREEAHETPLDSTSALEPDSGSGVR